MWWEIIPSAGIVFGAIMAPHFIYFGANKIFRNGKSTCRAWMRGVLYEDYFTYLRDIRITGSEYIPRGLEAIPDEYAK